MRIRRSTCAFVLALIAWSMPASAQTGPPETVTEGLTRLTSALIPAGPAIQAIALATALEVANAPVGSSAGGFVFKLDPATGLRVRTAPTFGPSFAERAITAGEGKVTFGASLSVGTYDKLNDFDLKKMQLAKGTSSVGTLTGYASLVLSSETFVISTAIGATDNLDISFSLPFVKVKMDGLSWLELNSPGNVVGRETSEVESSGIGDVSAGLKYRIKKFGDDLPDPGGIAVQLITRLPTGDRENLRGLGITRVLGNAIVSSGKGKLRPHGNVGFEWWEKTVEVDTDFTGATRVGARHQLIYAAGVEYQAGPKVTLLTDFVGRHVFGGGVVKSQSVTPPREAPGITSLELAVATSTAIRKWALAPGMKWNLKGSMVIGASGLISINDNGLRDYFTPVVTLDWTF